MIKRSDGGTAQTLKSSMWSKFSGLGLLSDGIGYESYKAVSWEPKKAITETRPG